MKKPFPKWLSLFLSFLKIGAFTFGGGYAMIALLENEFVSRKKWLEKEEFVDILAVAESTPGPIAVNTATYIGYKVAGVLGAILSTLAVCLPAFSIIFVISLVFDKFLSLKWVGYAFRGIQIAVVYLIGSAGIKVFKGLKKNIFSVTLCVLVFASFVTLSVLAVSFSSVFYILICGLLGLMLYAIDRYRAREKMISHEVPNEQPLEREDRSSEEVLSSATEPEEEVTLSDETSDEKGRDES